MIEHPAESDLPEMKSIWKEVFGDTHQFIESFFSGWYSQGSALVYRSGRVISSMIFFPGFDFIIEGVTYRMGYICGAATREEYRGKGLMAELIRASHDSMRKRGDLFAALIPASDSLYEYYRRFGYRDLFFRNRYVIEKKDIDITPRFSLVPADDLNLVYEIYGKGIRSLRASVIHSYNSYASVAEGFRQSGGEILAGSDRNLYSFVRVSGTVVSVREMFATVAYEAVRKELAAALLNYYPVAEYVEFESPVDFAGPGEERFRTGMGTGLAEKADQMLGNIPGAYMKFMLEE